MTHCINLAGDKTEVDKVPGLYFHDGVHIMRMFCHSETRQMDSC